MWRLREHVHAAVTAEGGAVLDERTGRWTYLSPTAAAAVAFLCASTGREGAVERYAARYNLPAGRAAADVAAVADALTAAGLAGDEPVVRRRFGWGWWR
ncbi:PqqD family peptide modification chaperone [Streptomyces sp. ST2-7A]|uniref:PqqD family peptide modification chaperone n=1 Tax=Streptomyces sp. ST2-7A TaxID=2907214 RepID=UPI001F273ED7|nr:PqqD family peptide modification chaperone [Streptomyces sp. ST2-7A]MCE7081428.1 PqqD family peptide modification chaperone [Streptomyces sp. ST2-7A]